VDNVREGFFERAEMEALLSHVEDADLRDFIAWGYRTGMRKGEIARLTWDMLDKTGTPWVLRIPGTITKNRTGRTLGLQGDVRAIIERRVRARRFDCPLIFHRVSKGQAGSPVDEFGHGDESVWSQDALDAAPLQHRHRARNGRRATARGRVSVDSTARAQRRKGTFRGQWRFRRGASPFVSIPIGGSG
jgi:integrase